MTHQWVKSTLGHGETMCAKCGITNREAAVLGLLNVCEKAEPDREQNGDTPQPDAHRDATGPEEILGVRTP